MPVIEEETPAGQELKTYDELAVGLPKDNLTILALARKVGRQLTRPPVPEDSASRAPWAAAERQRLSRLVRYQPVSLASTWAVANTKNKGVETKSYIFLMRDGLSANGLWLKAIEAPDPAPATIVLNDKGKKASGVEVADRVNRYDQVLALDLLFHGDAYKEPEPAAYIQIFHGLGERPLGIQAAQLIEIARWLQKTNGGQKVRLEATGIRNQVAALVATALQPNLFSALVVHEGMPSLGYLLEAPVEFHQAPELFCLDLYKEIDLDQLAAVAAPVKVTIEKFVETPKK
jgi:hypothetical protein